MRLPASQVQKKLRVPRNTPLIERPNIEKVMRVQVNRVKAELASKRRRNVVAVAAWVLDDDVAAALLSPGGGAATAPDEEAWDVAV